MLKIATVNVNGIRASFRRGMLPWLQAQDVDVLLLQEVRASDEILADHAEQLRWDDRRWHVASYAATEKGRAGVAILSRHELQDVQAGLPGQAPESTGRWIEATVTTPAGQDVRLASVYVHTGNADSPVQQLKYAFLDRMSERLEQLQSQTTIIGGDVNVGRDERDIKNWKGNLKKAGFLPEERAYLARWFEADWLDIGRELAGDQPGPYTWWSWRGQAFDNDAGWRIDYLITNPQVREALVDITVDRAPSYAERFSDHAPLRATVDL